MLANKRSTLRWSQRHTEQLRVLGVNNSKYSLFRLVMHRTSQPGQPIVRIPSMPAVFQRDTPSVKYTLTRASRHRSDKRTTIGEHEDPLDDDLLI